MHRHFLLLAVPFVLAYDWDNDDWPNTNTNNNNNWNNNNDWNDDDFAKKVQEMSDRTNQRNQDNMNRVSNDVNNMQKQNRDAINDFNARHKKSSEPAGLSTGLIIVIVFGSVIAVLVVAFIVYRCMYPYKLEQQLAEPMTRAPTFGISGGFKLKVGNKEYGGGGSAAVDVTDQGIGGGFSGSGYKAQDGYVKATDTASGEFGLSTAAPAYAAPVAELPSAAV